MPSAVDKLFEALEEVRKNAGDKAKVEASLKRAEAVAEEVEKEAAESEKKMKAAPKAGSTEGQTDTDNLAPVEDEEYDRERRMNAPYSSGERKALEDPAYRGGTETDWFNPSEVYQSPIERALDEPKLQLMRARRI